MRRVDDEDIHPCIHESPRAIAIVRRADRRRYAESSVLILVRVREVAPLVDVLDGNQAAQNSLLVHYGQLLDPMLAEYRLRFVEGGADRRGDEVLRRHRFAERAVEIALELEIAVGNDSDELSIAIDDGNAGDLEALHERDGFA